MATDLHFPSENFTTGFVPVSRVRPVRPHRFLKKISIKTRVVGKNCSIVKGEDTKDA